MNIGMKRFLMLLISFVFVISLFGCAFDATRFSESSFWGSQDDKPAKTDEQTENTPVPSPTGEPGSENWTIMIYMNGSDLESEGGEATANLQSLLNVALPESINVIIYTGGTAVWQNDLISPYYNQIWRVVDQELVLLESIDAKNMGDSGTLAEFLSYAQSNYTADKKALFFWDHGGGSIMGFGADELFNYDGLWLSEMAAAFRDSYDGQPYDLIGFDACLMASVETASILVPYAEYMVASEEIEPGGGWNYEYLFGQLAQNPDMAGEELGIAVTDGYYDKYLGTEMESIITCSVIDLSKIPALEESLAAFAGGLSGSVTAPETMSTLAVARQTAESYGDAPGQVSFDMIDLYDFVDLQEDADQTLSSDLLAAIEDAVVYEVSGFQRMYSYGLSIYFPF
ncbi:MAG: clostripain-related cysteine peptidase, partial [Eubacteriales bacterium]|nr:clostripain-related cysteine peptidase [Eubacteriales bacterium]